MNASLSRRELVTAALAGAAASAWHFNARSEGRTPINAAPLSDELIVVSGAGANIVVLKGPRGALLVDDGLAERTDEVLAVVEAFTGSRAVELVFNTSWRPEHTGANERLRAAGATILAHENTKRWMAAAFEVPWEHLKHAAQPAGALPDKTFAMDGNVEIGDRTIAYGCLPGAHTDGDVYVRFPDANVLAVGALLAVGRYPVVDYVTGGWIGGLERATKRLVEIADEKTRIVPSNGPVQGRKALEAQLELCTAVLDAVREALRGGHTLEEFAASKPTAAFDSARGDPALFLRLVYEGAVRHERELRDR
jgi:glyoxylase-like metal-dependent hydrolase (beta-lactamase superfamily II)